MQQQRGCVMRLAVAGVVSGLESLGQMLGRTKERLAAALLFSERERWLLWAPVALAFGVAGYFLLPMEPPLWAGPGWAGLFFSLAFFSRRHTWLVLIFLALAIAGCGLAAGQIRTMSVAAPVLKEKIGPVEVHGRLIEAGIGDGQQRYILDNLPIRGVATAETPLRARITVHVPSGNTPDGAPSHLVPGDYIRLTASLQPPPEPVAPGAWDFGRQSWFQGIGAVGFSYGAAELLEDAGGPPRRGISVWLRAAYGIGYQRASLPFWETAAAGLQRPC